MNNLVDDIKKEVEKIASYCWFIFTSLKYHLQMIIIINVVFGAIRTSWERSTRNKSRLLRASRAAPTQRSPRGSATRTRKRSKRRFWDCPL